jgi:hypothetical protein
LSNTIKKYILSLSIKSKIKKDVLHKTALTSTKNVQSSVIAPDGHSSTQAPQSTHFDASITAKSPTVIASCGHASAQASHAVHSFVLIIGISFTSGEKERFLYKDIC